MKTFSLKPADVKRRWYELDAAETTLGRLSVGAAKLLIGKSKPEYSPHVDNGDYVVITNAAKLKVTSDKLLKKTYYRHSGYPGNLRSKTLAEKMDESPSEVVRLAIRGMLPVNKLRDGRLARLKIYDGPEHENTAQKPEKITIKELK